MHLMIENGVGDSSKIVFELGNTKGEITVSYAQSADGVVELRSRRTGEVRDLPIDRAADGAIEAVLDERR